MKHLRIAVRMMILVLLAVGSVGAMGAAVLFINGRVFAAADRLTKEQAIADLATFLERKSASNRALIVRYAVTRDPATAEAISKGVTELSEGLAQLSNLSMSQDALPPLTAGIKAVQERVDALRALGTALGDSDEVGLIGEMQQAVRAVETELKQWFSLDAPLRMMETMRRAELEVMLGSNPAAEGLHRKSYNELDFMLSGLGMDPATTERVSGLIRTYRKSFVAVSEGLGGFRKGSTELIGQMDLMAGGFADLASQSAKAMARATVEQEQARTEGERMILIMAASLSVVFLVLAILLSLSITRPIVALEAALGLLRAGRVDSVVPGADRGDEVGRIARAAGGIRDTMLALHSEIRRVSGVTTTTLPASLGSGRAKLAGIFAEMVEVLRDTGTALQQIGHGTSMVAQSTDQASVAIRQVLDGAQAQLGEIKGVSDDLGRAVDALDNVAVATQSMAGIVATTATASEQSRAEVEQLTAVARTLASESLEVRRITNLIQEIAETTSILSVNASIEARRAGALGKGFDTVANQVRILAQNTEKAALEIQAIADSMANRSQQAVEASGVVLRRVADIAQQMARVNGHAQEVASVINDQHRSLPEIERRMDTIRSVASQNAVAAEEIKETMAQLALMSEATRQSTSRFLNLPGVEASVMSMSAPLAAN